MQYKNTQDIIHTVFIITLTVILCPLSSFVFLMQLQRTLPPPPPPPRQPNTATEKPPGQPDTATDRQSHVTTKIPPGKGEAPVNRIDLLLLTCSVLLVYIGTAYWTEMRKVI